jgi:hypothetical protein
MGGPYREYHHTRPLQPSATEKEKRERKVDTYYTGETMKRKERQEFRVGT